MKICKNCDTKKTVKEFNKDIDDEYLDICKECQDELRTDNENDSDDVTDYYNKD